MGVSRSALDYNLAFPFTADAAIAAASFVVGSTADDHITNPSGEGASGVIGFCDNAIANGAQGRVSTAGIAKARAAGAIARYQFVVVADATGAVKLFDPDKHAQSSIVGITTSTATQANDSVSVLMMIDSPANVFPQDGSIAFRARCVAVANVNITTGLVAGQAIDGVTLVAGDRVLLVAQTTASQNGLYVATAAGAASFAPEWKTGLVKAGCVVRIGSEQSTVTWKNSEWKATAAQTIAGGGLTVGTDDPVFYPRTQFGLGAVGTQVTALFAISANAPRCAIDITAANAVKAVLATGASRGAGTLDFTGTGVDQIEWAIFNW